MAFRHLTPQERLDREATELLRDERRRTKHHEPTRQAKSDGRLNGVATWHINEINDWLTPDQFERRP